MNGDNWALWKFKRLFDIVTEDQREPVEVIAKVAWRKNNAKAQ